MKKGIYFMLLFCGLLSQGICSSSKENNEAPSDIHSRQKRVIGGEKHNRNDAPYLITIVVIGNYLAPASLLTADTAITSAHVFKNQAHSTLSLESRSADGLRVHQIERLIFLDPRYNETHPTFKNLALVKFDPPVYFPTSFNRPISIHSGSIVQGNLEFHIVNWRKPFLSHRGRRISQSLETMPVQLISIEYCQQMYPGLIAPGNICTNAVNAGQQTMIIHDSGAPLTVGQSLLGIMVFHGLGRATNPDVFMNLMDTDIRRWIHAHVPSLRLF